MTLATRFIGYQTIHLIAAYMVAFGLLIVLAILVILSIYIPALQRAELYHGLLPLIIWLIPWLIFYTVLYIVLDRVFVDPKAKVAHQLRYLRAFTFFGKSL